MCFVYFFKTMDALGSIIGTRLPSPTNFINMSSRCMLIRLASQDALSHCSVTYRIHILAKASPPSKVVLQKAGSKYQGLGCRCSASETVSCMSNDDTSQKSTQRKRLAVFVSGGGSNFKAIHEATKRGLVHGDITVLVTDKPGMFCFWTFEVVAWKKLLVLLLLITYFCSFFLLFFLS